MSRQSRLRRCGTQRRCIVCGCTEDNACVTEEGPCFWVAENLCSNPDCLAKIEVSVVDTAAG